MTVNDRQDPGEPDPMGYAYWSPDVGNEWTPNHPVESGETPDARNILRMSRAEFLRQFPLDPEAGS